jgi:hypothetical protein
MAWHPDKSDAFYGGEKTPSLSWKGLPHGTIFTTEILEEATLIQSTDYESQEPAYWDAEKKRPKMAAVVKVLVTDGPHSVGEERSIWATIPSNIFIALKEAQKNAGAKFLPGGILKIAYTGEKPHENPRMNAIKQYAAKYEAPAGSKGPDPFGDEPAAPQPPAQQAFPQRQTAPASSGKPAW